MQFRRAISPCNLAVQSRRAISQSNFTKQSWSELNYSVENVHSNLIVLSRSTILQRKGLWTFIFDGADRRHAFIFEAIKLKLSQVPYYLSEQVLTKNESSSLKNEP